MWKVGEHAVAGKETLKFGSIFGSLPDFLSLRLKSRERESSRSVFTMCGEPCYRTNTLHQFHDADDTNVDVAPAAWHFTQIQLQIVLFLLFWDVLWIINDLLAPLSLFFQQNSQVFTHLGRVTYNHEYTQIYIKILSFKSLIYINYFYIFTEILILKTILVF